MFHRRYYLFLSCLDETLEGGGKLRQPAGRHDDGGGGGDGAGPRDLVRQVAAFRGRGGGAGDEEGDGAHGGGGAAGLDH